MRTEREIRAMLHIYTEPISSYRKSVNEALEWALSGPKQPPVWEDMGGLVKTPLQKLLTEPSIFEKPLVDPEEEEWRAWEAKEKKRFITIMRPKRFTLNSGILWESVKVLASNLEDIYWGARGVG